MKTVPDREELRAHLVKSRITGDVATPRENNLDNYRRMSEREPLYLFGLSPTGEWTREQVFALMVERCGVSPDPAYTRGPDTIDPERTLDRLDAMADRLRTAAQAGIDAVGYADCNDPALFVGEAEGLVRVCVPLDDNVAPNLYEPLTAYLLERAGL